MMGRTHAVIGANTAWLAVLFTPLDERAIVFVVAGALAGLLPDMDADDAKIHHLSKGFTRAFNGLFRHRGFLHSLIATAIVYILSVIFLRSYHPFLPIIFTAAYLSHLLLDALTVSGVRLLFPWKKRIRLLPRSIAPRTGKHLDNLLFILGVLALGAFVFAYYAPYLSTTSFLTI